MRVAPRFRDRVSIQERNLVDNGKGGRTRPAGEPEWVDLAGGEVWADVEPLRGQEATMHGVERSSQLYRVTVRTRSGLNAALRLLWPSPLGLIALELKGPPALSRDRRDMVMTCEGKAAA